MEVGDYIVVTSGTHSAEQFGWVGSVKQIIKLDEHCIDNLPFRVTDGEFDFWVNGVAASSLIKELL